VLLIKFAQPKVCKNSLNAVELFKGLKLKKRREARQWPILDAER